MMTCKTCRHFDRQGGHGGQCRRYPPTNHVFRGPNDDLVWEQARPWVGNDDTCGEHQPALESYAASFGPEHYGAAS
jgi:hypothetical protein